MNADIFNKMHLTGRNYWWYRAKEILIDRLLIRYQPPGCPAGRSGGCQEEGGEIRSRIADLGCGTGTMFGFLAERGRVTGIEPSKEAVRFAAMRGNARLIRGGACESPFRENSFDIVAMFDCLEHIEHDSEAVREVERIIRENGTLLITVPAFSGLSSWRETQLGHKRRYSKKALIRLVEDGGFRIIFCSYMYMLLFPVLVLKSIKDKLFRRPGVFKSDIVMLPEPWNSLLAYWFGCEAKICARWGLPIGTSLVCIAVPLRRGEGIETGPATRVEPRSEISENKEP